MNTAQKILLLRTGTAHPFTTKSALLDTVSAQFPGLGRLEIEEFFEGVVDFGAVEGEGNKLMVGNEGEGAGGEDGQTATLSLSSSPSPLPLLLPSSTPSPVSSPSESISNSSHPKSHSSDDLSAQKVQVQQSRSHSPPQNQTPLLVPARTPSGRTLRSNSTVNTSEPRRLRSNK